MTSYILLIACESGFENFAEMTQKSIVVRAFKNHYMSRLSYYSCLHDWFLSDKNTIMDKNLANIEAEVAEIAKKIYAAGLV